MDGQQVYVTGADGEQMVLSGPEAAALLAQAGISIGDNDQVVIGGDNPGEDTSGILNQMEQDWEGGAGPAGGDGGGEEGGEGIIQVPEGSSITEDGSIVAADGTVLAPPGSVVMGEDGTLMMTQDGALLMQGGDSSEEASAGQTSDYIQQGTGAAGEDGGSVDAAAPIPQTEIGESREEPATSTVTDQVVPAQEGNTENSETGGETAASSAGDKEKVADGANQKGDGMSSGEGGTVEEDNSKGATPEVLANDITANVAPNESESNVTDIGGDLEKQPQDGGPSTTMAMTIDGQMVPVPSGTQLMTTEDGQLIAVPTDTSSVRHQVITAEDGTMVAVSVGGGSDASAGKTQVLRTPDGSSADGRNVIGTAEKGQDAKSKEVSMTTAVGVSSTTTNTKAQTIPSVTSTTTEPACTSNPGVVYTTSEDMDISQAAAGAVGPPQVTYTTADGTVVSAPEGSIMANADGNLVTADGTLLTTEDGQPVSLPPGTLTSILGQSAASGGEQLIVGSSYASAAASLSAATSMASLSSNNVGGGIMSAGGIVVTAAGGTIMSDGSYVSAGSILPHAEHDQTAGFLASEDGVISAPEGSIITEDGSLLAADGTVLAPPGSVVAAPEQHQPQGDANQPQQQTHQQQQQQLPSNNLIGLQLPDENGEVLYLDPNDPAAQMLLQEAGITLGEGGVLQTADGQILTNEDGNPITSNLKQPATNNLVGDAVAAAGLVPEDLGGFQVTPTSHIDLPLSSQQHGTGTAASSVRPNLNIQSHTATSSGYDYHDVGEQQKASKHIFQPRYSANQPTTPKQPQQKFQKLTFNSAAAYSNNSGRQTTTNTTTNNSSIRKPVQKQQKKPQASSDMQIGPDQQKVTYTVTSENGYSQTYMMICSKSLDQNTLINTLIKNISNDPNHKGKKTIKITQHKYGTKKQKMQKPVGQVQSQHLQQQQQQQQLKHQQMVQQQLAQLQPQRVNVQQQQVRGGVAQTKTHYRAVPTQGRGAVASHLSTQQQQGLLPPAQILQTVDTKDGQHRNAQQQNQIPELITPDPTAIISEGLTLDDIVNQMGGDVTTAGLDSGDVRVMVKCSYCPNFKSVLNSQTWENILNHILPVAKEELHASFYGNILKNFSRGLKVGVSGKGEYSEVMLSHGLVCRRTGAWYSMDRPGVELATQLATHIAAVQPGVSGPYGARPRGNSLICLFCSSPYTAEDYQRHLKPHQEFIIPCLLLAAGAYCATSFDIDVRKSGVCETCHEAEYQDLRFLPCTKFSNEFNCGKKLQATVDCFRENFDSRGFLQVSNSSMTKCSVCRTQNQTYCALFKPSNQYLQTGDSDLLSVCANCQKQFVNVVMRENSFEKQLKLFQLHHMEQLCGMLRVLLTSSHPISEGQHHLLYTVQEGGSLYTASNTLHTVVPARPLHTPALHANIRGLKLEENKSFDMSGPQIRFVCDQCKFSIDLTRLQHPVGKTLSHLIDMAMSIVLEHIVPHTDSLLAVIMTSATNEIFNLKFEFVATVEGEGSSRRINLMLERKIVPVGSNSEIPVQKDVYKTVEALKARIKQDKKGNIALKNKYIFMDAVPPENSESSLMMECGKFLDQSESVLKLYGASGCNTRLLDYYSECRLCSKFSFPDFRLSAAVKRQEGVSLCENCCETIVSLCVPSEPEKIAGRGEPCLLLNEDKNTGHRLVLSNQSRKWISADGVERIQLVSEVAAAANIPDYSATLVQMLKNHLLAVCERSWSETECMAARAGFLVKPNAESSRMAPIEVKVTLRPPKPKTPPAKLMITPVVIKSGNQSAQKSANRTGGGSLSVKPVGSGKLSTTATPTTTGTADSMKTPTGGESKLVKITANRRIIPVRDPTSIHTPVRQKLLTPKEISTQEKVAALREALHASSRIAETKQQQASVTTATPTSASSTTASMESNQAGGGTTTTTTPTTPTTNTAGDVTPSGTGDGVKVEEKEGKKTGNGKEAQEDEADFETLEDIANFINSSEPAVTPKQSSQNQSQSNMYSLQDEFTDNSLKLSSQDPNKVSGYYKLPKGTIVTNVSPGPNSGKEASEVPMPLSEDDEANNSDSVKVPSNLKISEVADAAGMVKLQATAGNRVTAGNSPGSSGGRRLVELAGGKSPAGAGAMSESLLPSPASDATTSTRSTPVAKGNLIAGAGGKKSVVAGVDAQKTPKSDSASSSLPSTGKKAGRPKGSKNKPKLILDTRRDQLGLQSPQKKHSNPAASGDKLQPLMTSIDEAIFDLDEEEFLAEAGDEDLLDEGGVALNGEDKRELGSAGVNPLSKILPQSGIANTTPRTGKPGRPPSSIKKGLKGTPGKRKLEEGEEPKSVKKYKLSTPEPEFKDETPDFLKGVSQSGRVRKAKKVFDL